MALIAVGGFQHETNTFAPTRADYRAFEAGGGWPGAQFGAAIAPAVEGANIPAAGALESLHALGHRTVGLAWAAASPSAQVTRDAFERIAGAIVRRLAEAGPVDAVYLDLHGAMVAEHFDDGEGELLARVRKIVGDRTPIVASLDLHANVTRAMIDLADGLVAYRTYPHVDMAETGQRAAQLLDATLKRGRPMAKAWKTLNYLTAIPSQCSFIEPCKGLYRSLARIEQQPDWLRSPPAFRWPISPSSAWRCSATPRTKRRRVPRLRSSRAKWRMPRKTSRWNCSRPMTRSGARCSAANPGRRWCLPIPRTIRARAATATRRACSQR